MDYFFRKNINLMFYIYIYIYIRIFRSISFKKKSIIKFEFKTSKLNEVNLINNNGIQATSKLFISMVGGRRTEIINILLNLMNRGEIIDYI
jgi:hypothetical protein